VFCQLELVRIAETIESWYSLQRELSLKVAKEFILEQLSSSVALAAQLKFSVNAKLLR
jgi:hypothetical protein